MSQNDPNETDPEKTFLELPLRVRNVLWRHVTLPAVKWMLESGELSRTPGIADKGIEEVRAWIGKQQAIQDQQYCFGQLMEEHETLQRILGALVKPQPSS